MTGSPENIVQPQVEKREEVLTFWVKMKGEKKSPPRESFAEICWSLVGSTIGISVCAYLALQYHLPILVASFGATAVLTYAAINGPLSQPRNVIGGHMISALIAVTVYQLFGTLWWTVGLAVGLAITGMMLTRTLHPPGGATAIIAVLTGQDYSFVLTPIAAGAVIIVLIALIFNNLNPRRKYPMFWL